MLYWSDGVRKRTIYVGEDIPVYIAQTALYVQADGDELLHILDRLPWLSTGVGIQRFYGEDAVKALLTFVDWSSNG